MDTLQCIAIVLKKENNFIDFLLPSTISEFTKVCESLQDGSYKMIKMYLKVQDIFTRPNEFLPDMSGVRQSFVKTAI